MKQSHIKLAKILIFLIPILIILYLIYTNILVSQEFNSFYDIGSSSENYLSPSSRISNPENGTRNLTSNLVYFNIPIPRGSKVITAQVRVKDVFNNSVFILGAKDRQEWHYNWHTIYNPALESLSEYYVGNGVYQINKNLTLSPYDFGTVIGTSSQINSEPNTIKDFEGQTTISTTLRGSHTFYLYTSGNLSLSVTKQDINWYNGSDELSLSLYDPKGKLIATSTIPDDGIIKNSKKLGLPQKIELKAENLPEATYKLEISDFDGIIREIKLNSKKIVIANRVYVADSELYLPETKPSQLYSESSRATTIDFLTWHESSAQDILINSQKYSLQNKSTELSVQLEPGKYFITTPKSDLILETPGYFSFSKESYFEPFKNRIVPIKNDKDWILKNLDFLIVPDYQNSEKDGNWLILKASFFLNETYISDNSLSLVFNSPDLSEENPQFQIPIDWINITVNKPGILE